MSPDREEAIKALDRLTDDELHDVIHALAEDPRVKRRKGLRGWWYRYAGSVAFVALIVIAAVGFFRTDAAIDGNDQAIATINKERAARVDTVSGVIDLFCTTNNDQDFLLGTLVEISLSGPRPEDLTQRQRRFIRIFEDALAELEDPEDCVALVKSFQAGKPIPPEAGNANDR